MHPRSTPPGQSPFACHLGLGAIASWEGEMAKDKKARKKKSIAGMSLPVIRRNVAGIDIGSTEHWVCGPVGSEGQPTVRVFGTTTAQLYELVDWMIQQGVESVAMESTSVYWIPLYELLESLSLIHI